MSGKLTVRKSNASPLQNLNMMACQSENLDMTQHFSTLMSQGSQAPRVLFKPWVIDEVVNMA